MLSEVIQQYKSHWSLKHYNLSQLFYSFLINNINCDAPFILFCNIRIIVDVSKQKVLNINQQFKISYFINVSQFAELEIYAKPAWASIAVYCDKIKDSSNNTDFTSRVMSLHGSVSMLKASQVRATNYYKSCSLQILQSLKSNSVIGNYITKIVPNYYKMNKSEINSDEILAQRATR